MLIEMKNDVSFEMLEDSKVSKKQYDQIISLLEINPQMFSTGDVQGSVKTHVPHAHTENPFDSFVDFTQLPENLPKDAKNLLYRP